MVSFGAAAVAFAFLGHNGRNRNLRNPALPSRRTHHYSHSHIVSPYAATPLRQLSEDDLLAAHDDFSKENMEGWDLQDISELLQVRNRILRVETQQADGIRGVYTESAVPAGDLLLQIPLDSCLLDNAPPQWYRKAQEEQAREQVGEGASYSNPSEWAPRLAASVVDLQLQSRKNKDAAEVDNNSNNNIAQGQQLWLSFLPNADYLRASLPVHWSDEILSSARCTALELAVDSSYFARAEAVADLMAGLCHHYDDDTVETMSTEELTQLCHNALDVVQTRSCRAEWTDSEEPPLRVLAPVFDLINHGSSHGTGGGTANARFGVEDHNDDNGKARPHLCVRAVKDVGANEEVLIDYGDSARPSWKCLLSYGFVPLYDMNGDEDDDDDEESLAEVFFEGKRYEVGPTAIPFDLVAAATSPLIKEEDIVLTKEIALKLAERISVVSFYLLVDDEKRSQKNENDDNDDDDDDDLDFIESAEDLTSWQLAASLRWSQHHILRACANGLQDWANDQ